MVDDNDDDGFEILTLDGTQSTDPDGLIASYQWYEETPLEGMLLLGTGQTLDAAFARGSHTARLIVIDNSGNRASTFPMKLVTSSR